MNSTNVIGFIGLGIMGKPMALNLLRAGFTLNVHARRPESMAPLAEAGASTHENTSSLAAESDVIIIMVSDTPDVESVLQTIHDALRPGSMVIDMSTISPEKTREFAESLRAKGVDMLDAPVSGGEVGAIDGTLSIMVGGKDSTFQKALPVFEVLGKNIIHVGDHGAGQVAKACNQIVVAQTMAAVAEAYLLARASNVDPARVREALLGGFAYSKILEVHGRRMLENDYKPGFKSRLHDKDLHIAVNSARAHALNLPSAELMRDYMDKVVEAGDGELDSAAIAKIIEAQSNLGSA